MKQAILIINYGMGNLLSVKKKLSRLKIDATISSSPKDIEFADKLILPGVGHFQRAVENLKKLNLSDSINEAVLIKRKPILGICLGMQLMAKKSEEGNAEGFGWLDAEVLKFRFPEKIKFKIPHMGWNQITKTKDSLLMKGIDELSEFYFAHSYYMKMNDRSKILNETKYGCRFTSAIEKANIFGVQYHPEKSHDAGEVFLRNFISL